MKDSKKYSPKVTKLFNALKRKGGRYEMSTFRDPIEAVVYALISEQVPESLAWRLYKRLCHHFVDLNDLRVSRKEEILDVFKDASAELEQSAAAITKALHTVFEKNDRVSLDDLTHEGKRIGHKELSEIDGITPFAVSYCFLTALGGHAIPLNAKILAYLRANELVHPQATDAEIAGFLERQISAADAYTFYMLLREEAEQPEPTIEAKPSAKKNTTKKKAAVAGRTGQKKKTATKKKTASKKKVPKK